MYCMVMVCCYIMGRFQYSLAIGYLVSRSVFFHSYFSCVYFIEHINMNILFLQVIFDALLISLLECFH